jgi:hypothetical protein
VPARPGAEADAVRELELGDLVGAGARSAGGSTGSARPSRTPRRRTASWPKCSGSPACCATSRRSHPGPPTRAAATYGITRTATASASKAAAPSSSPAAQTRRPPRRAAPGARRRRSRPPPPHLPRRSAARACRPSPGRGEARGAARRRPRCGHPHSVVAGLRSWRRRGSSGEIRPRSYITSLAVRRDVVIKLPLACVP